MKANETQFELADGTLVNTKDYARSEGRWFIFDKTFDAPLKVVAIVYGSGDRMTLACERWLHPGDKLGINA